MRMLKEIIELSKKCEGTLSFQINGNAELDEVWFGGSTTYSINEETIFIAEDQNIEGIVDKRCVLFRLDKIDSVIEV